MKKNILVVGCSFSHHMEDENCNKVKAWPDIMSETFTEDLYVCNISLPGASNELIKRMVTKKSMEQHWDYIIIQWSTIDRWDYPITHDENNCFVRYWPNGSNLGQKNENFYKHYYSVYGAVIDTLENILFTQQFLNSENIPYSMITIGNLFTLSTTILQIQNLMDKGGDYYGVRENVLEKMERMQNIYADTDSITVLLNKVDLNKFVFTDDNRNPFGGGMLEWIYNEKNDYPKCNWHFDENQANSFFEEFIKPNILIKNGLI